MALGNGNSYPTPDFTPEVVSAQLRDGYWLEALDVDGDGKPDLMGSGLTLGEVYWYRNPDWTRRLVVDRIAMPIAMDFADITGNGRPDVVLCYDLYGPGGTIDDPKSDGGKIDWLERPEEPASEARWTRRHVGHICGTHRLRIGHFTQNERWEIVAFPIVAMEGVHSLLPVVMFTQPDDVRHAAEWRMAVIDDCHFRMIHGAVVKRGLIPGSALDSLLVASDEGITWLYYDPADRRWVRKLVGTGELTQFDNTGFRGSGDVDGGRIGDDPLAYIAAVEPFHGNSVAIYHKTPGSSAGDPTWRRVLLDVFGDPNGKGEGTGHSVLCGDFDGDGDDEFLVGLRGPAPWQGVFYYKAVDIRNGVFVKWRVASESAARIVAADFTGNGRLDFATIAYKVPNYYEAKDAKLMVYHNRIGSRAASTN